MNLKKYPQPRFEAVPEEVVYYGQRTMRMVSARNWEKQGIFEFLDRLEEHFQLTSVTLINHRIGLLKHCVKDFAVRTEIAELIQSGRQRSRQERRVFPWSEVRKILLDHYSPMTWLDDVVNLWQCSHKQGQKDGRTYLLKFQQWNVVINRLLPDNQPAISKEFQALLMRAGVTARLEYELSTLRYNVYDPTEAQRAIMQGADRHRDGCAELASECEGQKKHIGPAHSALASEPEAAQVSAGPRRNYESQ